VLKPISGSLDSKAVIAFCDYLYFKQKVVSQHATPSLLGSATFFITTTRMELATFCAHQFRIMSSNKKMFNFSASAMTLSFSKF
jgi:hypothetical protein